MDAYSLLTNVGRLYIAPVGTAFPDLDEAPGVSWRDLGDTQDGVDMNSDDKIELVRKMKTSRKHIGYVRTSKKRLKEIK